MSMLRTFVAVEISTKVRERAAGLVDDLRAGGADVKWVNPQNLHFTLNFLGDVDERDVAEVCTAVRAAVEQTRPFQLQSHGVGAFPSASRPRTVWIGVAQGHSEVCQLQSATADRLAKLGYPKEHRRFHPHLTLGRVKRAGKGAEQLAERISQLHDFDAGTSDIREVIVFSSQLQSSGPVYEALSRSPLTDDL